MSEQEAARRYLQASMSAGYTGLPDEHREAHEGTMRDLERKHPNVRTRALVGAAADFDKPLSVGEREHQAHLRDKEGIKHADVLRGRRELRGGRAPAPRSSGNSRKGRAAVKAYARAQRSVISSSGVQSTGSIVLEAIGIGVGLSLLYLTLSPNGSKALSLLLGGFTKVIRLLVGPFDPLNPSGATSAASGESIGPPGLPGGAIAASSTQRTKLNPKFGPAPGIGSIITPVGVTK